VAPAGAASARPPGYAGYLFAYFTGEGTADGEQVYFGLSEGNDPRGDRFSLIATDLRMYGRDDWERTWRHGSRSIVVWESADLVRWSAPRLVQVAPETAGNVWAPEAFYDPVRGEYVVFWASTHSVIDSTVLRHDGRYITEEKSAVLTSPAYRLVKDCIGKDAIVGGEGPLVFRSNTEQQWYLLIDEYGGAGYRPFETTDLNSGDWRPVANAQLPGRPRHGTVLPVTQAEYQRLAAEYQR
jgi:hypothetical protein